jgi:hypothetical protein
VPRLRFILRIEPDDDDSRVMYAEYQDTFGFTVLSADPMDDASTRATDADVIVMGIRVPGSRTPKCEEVHRRVMVL